MSDPVRPDPATRDPEANLAEDLIAAELIAGGHDRDVAYRFAEGILRRLAARDFRVVANVPPPLPDEPPDGTVLRGNGTDLWQRNDGPDGIDGNGYARGSWWRTGGPGEWTWAQAVKQGADAGRRLIELPDPDEEYALDDIRHRAASIISSGPGDWIAATLRALAERGNHDG